MWFALEALAGLLSQLKARRHRAFKLANIVSGGTMVGSAIFDPISATENHQYCKIVLPMFAVSAVIWHLLNFNAMLKTGCFTVPLGLVLLLLLVNIFAGPSRTDLVAWLPLYITTVSLITISLPHILGWPSHNPSIPPGDNSIEASSPGENDDGSRVNRDSPALTRWRIEPTARYHLAQDLHHTNLHISDSDRSGTTLSLSSTPGQARPSWGSHVLGFWINPLNLFHGRQQPQTRRPDLETGTGGPLDPYHDDEPPAEQDSLNITSAGPDLPTCES